MLLWSTREINFEGYVFLVFVWITSHLLNFVGIKWSMPGSTHDLFRCLMQVRKRQSEK